MPDTPKPEVVIRPQLPPLQTRVQTAVGKIEAKRGEPAPAAVPNTPAGDALAQKTAEKAAAEAKAAAEQPKPSGESPKPEDDGASRKDYIQLAKLEAKVQADRRAAQAEREAAARERDAALRERQHYENLRARAKTDPDSVAKDLGLDYSAWTNQVLGKPKTAEEIAKTAVEEVQALKEELQVEREEGRDAELRRLRDERLGVARQFQTEVSEWLAEKAKEYEAIHTFGLGPQVYGLIRSTYTREGKLLSPKEAADALEEAILGAVEEFVGKEKWTARSKAKSTPASPQKDAKQEASGSVRTVSNEMTPEAGSVNGQSGKRVTQAEAIARAVESYRAKKAAI